MTAASDWARRRVLVTGAGGFLASALVRRLVAEGAHVVGIVRDSPGLRLLDGLDLTRRIDVVRGDITDAGLVERVVAEYAIDTVFHLAAQTQVGVANASPVSTFTSNIAGTWLLLEACRVNPSVARVVVASSDKAYGNTPVLPYTEDTPLLGSFPYDASKVCTDVLTRCYAVSYGMPAAIVRCGNIYGPGDLNWERIVPGTIRSVLRGEAPVIRSDGTPERDYLYVDDAVAGYLAVAEHLPAVAGEPFNLGADAPVSAAGLVDRILERTGRPDLRPLVLGTATNEIDRQSLASGKAREVLGWAPATGLDEGLDECARWYGAHLGPEAGERQEVPA